MAADAQEKTPGLAEQWSIQEKEQENQIEEVATKEAEVVGLTDASSEEVVALSPNETPTSDISSEETDEVPANEQEDAEEKSEIKIETAPADFRFPTTNQTRHCFTRYIEYHRCIAAKGEDVPECDKFAKYYRSLCPSEWVERWNEQRENGTFPGPL